MLCIVCHSEDIQYQNVQEEINVENNIVRATVNALVCLSCGERYYDRRTVRKLEEIERSVKAGNAPLTESGRVLLYEGV